MARHQVKDGKGRELIVALKGQHEGQFRYWKNSVSCFYQCRYLGCIICTFDFQGARLGETGERMYRISL